MAKSPPKVKEITLPLRGYRAQWVPFGACDGYFKATEVYCETETVHGKTEAEAIKNVEAAAEVASTWIFGISCYLSAWLAVSIIAGFSGCTPVALLGFAPVIALIAAHVTGFINYLGTK